MTFESVTLANGRATLYLGDCLELKAAGLLKADAVVSDPPYGIGFKHSGACGSPHSTMKGGSMAHVKSNTDPIFGDDAPFDPAPWLGFERVILFGADHFRKRLPDGGRFLCWDKSVGIGPADSFADAEYLWCSLPNIKRTVHRQLWKGVNGTGKDRPNAGKPRYHSSQKPRELMRWCIQTIRPRPDSLILDPYMGSGSTGIAALSLGHRFVGVEIERRHFDTACMRIEKEAAEMGLVS